MRGSELHQAPLDLGQHLGGQLAPSLGRYVVPAQLLPEGSSILAGGGRVRAVGCLDGATAAAVLGELSACFSILRASSTAASRSQHPTRHLNEVKVTLDLGLALAQGFLALLARVVDGFRILSSGWDVLQMFLALGSDPSMLRILKASPAFHTDLDCGLLGRDGLAGADLRSLWPPAWDDFGRFASLPGPLAGLLLLLTGLDASLAMSAPEVGKGYLSKVAASLGSSRDRVLEQSGLYGFQSNTRSKCDVYILKPDVKSHAHQLELPSPVHCDARQRRDSAGGKQPTSLRQEFSPAGSPCPI